MTNDQKKAEKTQLIVIFILLALLLIFVFGFGLIEDQLYATVANGFVQQGHYNLPKLTLEFLEVALAACFIAIPFGFFLGLFCFSEIGSSFKIVIDKGATILNTVPTMAVMALFTMAVGFGKFPTIIALVIQSILPLIFATVSGISSVPPQYLENARGMGMTPGQILWKVQVPMAMPVLLSGFKTSLILCISAATLAYNTGGGGLGRLISAGYTTYNNLLVFEGTVPICLIALLADALVKYAELKLNRIKS